MCSTVTSLMLFYLVITQRFNYAVTFANEGAGDFAVAKEAIAHEG